MMLAGIVLVIPGFFTGYIYYSNPQRKHVLKRRIKLAGWLFGVLTLIMFPNVFTIPSQIVRHLNPTETVITPNEPLVLQFKHQFFSQYCNSTYFNSVSFADKMLLVDYFIRDKIAWQTDYKLYKMSGLLLTPREVLETMSGDCQGQAVTTVSLLLAMGYRAWAVETPFHWWTHAEDPETGQSINLNVHGHGGKYGSVLPQPIDLIYTRPPTKCDQCEEMLKHNTQGMYFIAPPHQAFAIAMTGAHIFVRSDLTLATANKLQLVFLGLGVGLIVALYASYFSGEITWQLLAKRFVVASALGVGPLFFGLVTWATVFYPVATMHLYAMATFALTYVSSASFNRAIK